MPESSFIILHNNNIIAHNHHTNNNPHIFQPQNQLIQMNERVDILMAENSLMVEQKAILTTELDGTQEELTKRTRDVELLSDSLASTTKGKFSSLVV